VLDQYAQLRKRNAFVDAYKKSALFGTGLEEFDQSRWEFQNITLVELNKSLGFREVVQDLLEEYEACEQPSYLEYVGGRGKGGWYFCRR
jgi:tubulin gamma